MKGLAKFVGDATRRLLGAFISGVVNFYVVKITKSVNARLLLTLVSTSGSILRLKKMHSGELKIGELATRAGVSVDVLRYYERLKLLPRARRSSGGYRLFEPESIERVKFIRESQKLGLSLNEIRGLLTTGGADECKNVCELLRTKLQEIDDQIGSMKTFRRVLSQHLRDCERELQQHGSSACCPVLTGIKRSQRNS